MLDEPPRRLRGMHWALAYSTRRIIDRSKRLVDATRQLRALSRKIRRERPPRRQSS